MCRASWFFELMVLSLLLTTLALTDTGDRVKGSRFYEVLRRASVHM